MADSILGIPDDQLRELPKDQTILGVLSKFGIDLEKDLKQSLANSGSPSSSDTGSLEQSILFDIKFLGDVWRFQLVSEDYLPFLDEGVKGVGGTRKTTSLFSGANKGRIFKQNAPQSRFSYKEGSKPSVRHFEGWAHRKGISPFAVRESVFRQGLKPTRFYTKVIEDGRFEELAVALGQAAAKEVTLDIVNNIKGTAR